MILKPIKEWSIIKFIHNIIRSDKPESSKRFVGIIGYFSIVVICFILLNKGIIIDDNKTSILKAVLYTSASLLGLDTAIHIFKKKDAKQE